MAEVSRLAGEIVRQGDSGSPALGPVSRDNGEGELAKLVAEGELFAFERVDGDSHAGDEAEARDADRTAWLLKQGYRMIRFTNEDVHKRFDAVIEAVLLECVCKT